MDFGETYQQYVNDIRITALSQRVPGLDLDDVISEMLACLWQAVEKFDPGNGASFGSYWWSLWLNRKTDIIRLWNAQKRVHPFLTDNLEAGAKELRLMPEAPCGSGPLEAAMWVMLASGDERQDVLSDLGMSKRRYYDILHSWRSDDVRESLRDSF